MNAAQPKKRQHPPTPLGNFMNEYGLSLSQLSSWLKDAGEPVNSRATLSRIVHGKLGIHLAARINPKLATIFSRFLLARGLEKADIDAQLTEIFTEGEYQPMISRRIALTDAECRFFNLVDAERRPCDPFKQYPQSRDEVFLPPALREIYDRLIDAIQYRHFVACIGPIGSGKTTLRALVEDHVATDEKLKVVWPEFFDQAKVTPFEIARTILRECDAHVPARSTALSTAVRQKLASMTANGRRVALAFDECHKMNKDAVRSLKNFFEMSSGGFQKYLGIILFGWPSFVSTLEMPEFQEIYERVHVLEMPDFHTYAADYLKHRLKLVGVKMDDLFDKEAVDLICSQSETPLSLGNITNEALRISMRDFENKKVLGAAIKTKMHFESPRETLAFKKRA